MHIGDLGKTISFTLVLRRTRGWQLRVPTNDVYQDAPYKGLFGTEISRRTSFRPSRCIHTPAVNPAENDENMLPDRASTISSARARGLGIAKRERRTSKSKFLLDRRLDQACNGASTLYEAKRPWVVPYQTPGRIKGLSDSRTRRGRRCTTGTCPCHESRVHGSLGPLSFHTE